MQNYVVNLNSAIADSFRCTKAANSVNLDMEQRSVHRLEVDADLDTDFNIGLIVGSSGSGKTSLAKKVYGDDCLDEILEMSSPIIDQFPKEYTYEDCAAHLTGMGLTSIPCWIRPAYTLSTGQRARAEASLRIGMAGDNPTVIDEWTSTVDRDVAKVMSHCIQKHARRKKKQVVLVSCHRDVIDWLNPDWIIDCNKQTYTDRRSMVGSHKRRDRLRLDIRECSRKSWKYFSKFHYLNSKLPGGKAFFFGLFNGEDQIGFQCFCCYSYSDQMLMHSARVVIHPDFVGLGLGIKLSTESSEILAQSGHRILAKFAAVPMFKAMRGHPQWICRDIKRHVTDRSNTPVRRDIQNRNGSISYAAKRNRSKLNKVTYFYYEFIPRQKPEGQKFCSKTPPRQFRSRSNSRSSRKANSPAPVDA